MDKRASKTAYFLNRALGYLALIGKNVRLPDGPGVWILVADAVRAPWEVADLLAATYPGIDAGQLPFTALLTDFDVEEFERELQATGRLTAPAPVPVELESAEPEMGEPAAEGAAAAVTGELEAAAAAVTGEFEAAAVAVKDALEGAIGKAEPEEGGETPPPLPEPAR
jgi:hypothetical protein